MGLLSKMFGQHPATPQELAVSADEFLTEIETLLRQGPQPAKKLLLKGWRRLAPALDFEGTYHSRFRRALFQLLIAERPELAGYLDATPELQVIDVTAQLTLNGLIDMLSGPAQGLVYLRSIEKWGINTAAALEALALFCTDSRTELVYVTEDCLMLRRELLRQNAATLGLDLSIKDLPEKLFYELEKQPGLEFVDGLNSACGFELKTFRRKA